MESENEIKEGIQHHSPLSCEQHFDEDRLTLKDRTLFATIRLGGEGLGS